MGVDRRKFLKLSGLTALGLISQGSFDVFAEGEEPQVSTQKEPLVANRWAMVIDINKCLEQEDCTDCIDACHLVHNVPDFKNQKEEIKWIWKEKYENTFAIHEYEYIKEGLKGTPILTLCNHCDNPPCVRVCPTKATWKREEDGIVMMDWHRCIGCRYCIAACPYGSRSFNWRDPTPKIDDIDESFPTRTKGVVEKCNFCEARLDRGLMPACVEACENNALVFGDLDDPKSEVRRLLRENFAIRRKPELGTKPEVYYLV